jgi:5-methylthioribose kinase
MSLAPAVELTASNAIDYLHSRGVSPVRVSELAGGVSNTVLLVETDTGRFVLKQSLPQLRVEQQWLSDRSRIWREAAGLDAVARHLPRGSVPAVLFRDDANYVFAMTAAPEGARTWKAALLKGECDLSVAERIGEITAALISCGFQSAEMEQAFGDLAIFEQLRLHPYYRTVAIRHPDLAGFFNKLADSYPYRRYALTHGDWSPKNFLVGPGSIMAIDFEAIHYGDPAFDAAFLLNHLLLKSFHLKHRASAFAALAESFWTALNHGIPEVPDFEAHTLEHLGALLLCRMDGKSPAEYISDPELKQQIRMFARRLIIQPPASVLEVFGLCL